MRMVPAGGLVGRPQQSFFKLSTRLTAADLEAASDRLNVEVACIKAVVTVESRGRGFLPSGKVKILFERHIFWRQLRARGVDPTSFGSAAPPNEDLSVLSPVRGGYLGGEREHERFDRAVAISEASTGGSGAAICAASWGLFQIMGFNHGPCGFDTAEAFMVRQAEGEREQLLTFCSFLEHENLDDPLRAYDWVAFARRYNGPAYAENHYDTKLADAYEASL